MGVIICKDSSKCSQLLPTHGLDDKFLIPGKAEELTRFAIGCKNLETRIDRGKVFACAEPVEVTEGGECCAVALAEEEGGLGAGEEVGGRAGARDGVVGG